MINLMSRKKLKIHNIIYQEKLKLKIFEKMMKDPREGEGEGVVGSAHFQKIWHTLLQVAIMMWVLLAWLLIVCVNGLSDNPVVGDDVYVTLTLDVCRYSEHISFNTRCFNGEFVGPEITVKQGDVLHVTVINNLGPESSDFAPMNELHYPNHTSLHFHGIHASPHEDNIFEIIEPGENATLTIHIGFEHYPGTHWYHAHYHGSSAFQIFSGLHGAFIIEPREPQVFYSEFFKQLRPVVLVFSNLKMYSFDNKEWHGFIEYQELIGDTMDMDLEMDYSLHNNTFAINGKYQPNVELAVGKWVWLRMINAGASLIIPMVFNSSDCEEYAIGVDGVFLDQPIELSAYYIFPGSRLDVAVRCHAPGLHSVQFWKDPDNIWIYRGVDSGDDQLLFQLEAVGEREGTSLSIRDYVVPQKPEYLRDLTSVPDHEIAARFTIDSDFIDEDWDFFGLNHQRWAGSGNSTLFTMEIGKVYEILFTTDLAVHPIHVHINHMQIVTDEEVAWSNFSTHAMHQVGTWRGNPLFCFCSPF
jgi:FtsP/CotA-like multicopper oxidase with cupredoxin domain